MNETTYTHRWHAYGTWRKYTIDNDSSHMNEQHVPYEWAIPHMNETTYTRDEISGMNSCVCVQNKVLGLFCERFLFLVGLFWNRGLVFERAYKSPHTDLHTFKLSPSYVAWHIHMGHAAHSYVASRCVWYMCGMSHMHESYHTTHSHGTCRSLVCY